MAVSIDTVYQRVLTLANKEQRGYITPQEFNLLANHAQMEIFEQYFADVAVNSKLPGNTEAYSDPLNILYEKIGIFEAVDSTNTINDNSIYVGAGGSGINKILPDYIYRINRVELNGVDCEIINTQQFSEIKLMPLLKPTAAMPVANIRRNILRVNNGNPVTPTGIKYIRKPAKVEWAYVVVNDKALYNANIAVDFELHASEETELVYKILKLAGFNLKSAEVAQGAMGLEQGNKQTTL
tara:strand:- start:251 stop:967 length:717 start_codon:yes stop_codon:yes gene_type:complete